MMLPMIIEFAELVGLICHYRQEKGDREALEPVINFVYSACVTYCVYIVNTSGH